MDAIKDHILRGNLQPGDPLPTEAQMCDELGVSRSSVREAMRTLSALDIVEVRHGHGTFVGPVSMQPMVESLVFRGLLNPGDDFRALRNIVEVRLALDLAFADSVCATWKDRPKDPRLEEAVEEMEHLAQNGKLFPDADRLFHSLLLEPLENQLFVQLTQAFWDVHSTTAPLLGAPTVEDILRTARAHRDMLNTALAGDADAYREAVHDHYRPLLGSLPARS